MIIELLRSNPVDKRLGFPKNSSRSCGIQRGWPSLPYISIGRAVCVTVSLVRSGLFYKTRLRRKNAEGTIEGAGQFGK